MPDSLRILWLKTGPLHPLDTGGKIRTYHMLRELRRRHHVTYLSLWPDGTEESARAAAAEYSQAQTWIPWRETTKRSLQFYLELLRNFSCTRLPYAIQKYDSRAWADAIRQADAGGAHDLIICDFLTPAVNLFPDGRRPRLPVLLFQHNVESLIWRRTFENANGVARPYFRGQWRRMVCFEREACARADQVCAVSEDDARLLREELGLRNVRGAVPTGVDVDFFRPTGEPRQPRTLVFLGSMDWMPNIDGILWFAAEMWPRIKAGFPDARLKIVGRKPVPKVLELAANDAAIEVTGTVPDVRPHLASAALMIVPLRVGGGTRIKIFEGMATGIPCLSTRIGAEGLPVTHDVDVLLADEPEEFAGQVTRALAEPERAATIGRQGRELVEQRFSWAKVNEVFEGYCRGTVAARSGGVR